MKRRTKRIIIGASAVLLLAVLIFVTSTQIGQFLQSSTLFNAAYISRDAGIYVGREENVSTGKLLKAQQGLMLRAAPTKTGTTNVVDVFVTVYNPDDSFTPDALRTVISYNRNALILKDVKNIVPHTGISVNEGFTQILKDSSGLEEGVLYLGLDKQGSMIKPSEELVRLRFEAKDQNVMSSSVTAETVRLYKKEDLNDAQKPTLFLTKNEGEKTIVEPVKVLFDGSRVETNETSVAGGLIVKVEKHYNAAGLLVKTIETTRDTLGRIIKVQTLYADNSSEVSTYEYLADNAYKVTTTYRKASGEMLSNVLHYNKEGVLVQGNIPTQTILTDASAQQNVRSSAENQNTNGVTTAVNTTNTNNGSSVGAGTATTTAVTCAASANERFNDTVGHWSSDVVERARQKCIIAGKTLGRFAPDEAVTRAELTKIAVEAFKVAQVQNGAIGFADVSDSEWYANYVRAAKVASIINGYNDGTFKPNNSINRAEALKIILEAGVKTRGTELGLNIDGRLSSWMSQNPTYTYVRFPDVKIADWFSKYVLSGFEKGVVSGYNDRGTDVFRPGQAVTRAEAVKMIMSIVE